MNAAQARREAWWRASSIVSAALENDYGADLAQRYGEKDGALVEAQLEEVVAIMERRGTRVE